MHYQYCLQSVHVCVKPDDTENLQLGDSEAMTGSLLFQICFRLLWASYLQEHSDFEYRYQTSIIFLSRQSFIDCIVTPILWTI
jgi:hypothetical protein